MNNRCTAHPANCKMVCKLHPPGTGLRVLVLKNLTNVSKRSSFIMDCQKSCTNKAWTYFMNIFNDDGKTIGLFMDRETDKACPRSNALMASMNILKFVRVIYQI